MATIWGVSEAVVKIDAAADVTITSGGALDSFFGSATAIEAKMKDISITEPIQDTEIVNLLGEDANKFQNADKDRKPAGLAECTGTLILSGDENIESEVFSGVSSAITGGFTRYQPAKTTMAEVSILLNLDDGTDEFNVVLDNADLTSRDLPITGSDGHFEMNVTFKCLPKDYYFEFKD